MKPFLEEFDEAGQSRMKMYQKWVDDTERSIKEVRKNFLQYIPARLREIINNDGLFAYFSPYGTGWVEFELMIPWNPKLADEILILLRRFEWYIVYEKDDTSNDKPSHEFQLRNKNIQRMQIKIKMCSYDENSTCQLVEVGTEVVERPIYEVRCSDDLENI